MLPHNKRYASGEGLSAPILQSKSSGHGVSATGNGPLRFGVSGSKSSQTSHTEVAAMDVNGDGYPDWIDEGDSHVRTQYTSPTGTLSQLSVKTDIPMPEFSSGAYSLGIGNDGAIAVSIGNRNRSESGRATGNSSPGDVGSMNNANENPNKTTTPTNNSGRMPVTVMPFPAWPSQPAVISLMETPRLHAIGWTGMVTDYPIWLKAMP